MAAAAEREAFAAIGELGRRELDSRKGTSPYAKYLL